jgi:hypothetical protein
MTNMFVQWLFASMDYFARFFIFNDFAVPVVESIYDSMDPSIFVLFMVVIITYCLFLKRSFMPFFWLSI